MDFSFIKYVTFTLALVFIGLFLLVIGVSSGLHLGTLELKIESLWKQVLCSAVGIIAMTASVVFEWHRRTNTLVRPEAARKGNDSESRNAKLKSSNNTAQDEAEYFVENEDTTYTWRVLSKHCVVQTRLEIVALRDGVKGIPQLFGPADKIRVRLRSLTPNVLIRLEDIAQPASNKRGFFIDFQRSLKKGDRFAFEFEAEGKAIENAFMPSRVSVTAVHLMGKLTIRVVFPKCDPHLVTFQEYSLNDQSEYTETISVNRATLAASKTIEKVKYGNTYYLRWDVESAGLLGKSGTA